MFARASWQHALLLLLCALWHQLTGPASVDGATVDVMWLISRQTFYDVSVTSSIGALALAVSKATTTSNDTYQ